MVARKRSGQRANAGGYTNRMLARRAVELEDVLAAVKSLYGDQMKPVSRILRKRMAEHAAARDVEQGRQGDAQGEICNDSLRAICEACAELVVKAEEAGDWAALLVDRPCDFVDVYDQTDSYPEDLWQELAAYCKGDAGMPRRLPGGRYACALALRESNARCLSGRPLGVVAHIVQLALSSKKLLGYNNGAIVPYSHSQSMLKEECAKSHCPCSASGAPMLVANWEVARGCLWQILQGSPGGQLPLPNVKRLFRSRFHLDLSETAFGYSKVSELLQDSRFGDICEVQLHGHGYIVVQRRGGRVSTTSLQDSLSETAAPSVAIASNGEMPQRVEIDETFLRDADTVCKDVPVSIAQTSVADDTVPVDKWLPVLLVETPMASTVSTDLCFTPSTCLALSRDGYRGIIQNTFIQFKQAPTTPRFPSSRSMPAGLSLLGQIDSGETLDTEDDQTSDVSDSDAEDKQSLAENQLNPLREILEALPKGCTQPAGAGTPFSVRAFAMSTPNALYTPGSRRKPGCRINFCLDEPLDDLECLSQSAFPNPQQMFPATPFTPSCKDWTPQVATVQESAKPTLELPTLLAPGVLSSQGLLVNNTFLELKKAPSTPFMKQEARRSKSVEHRSCFSSQH